MRKSIITILGACYLLIATVVPAAAETDSTVHKNYVRASGYASGLDQGVLLSVSVERVQKNTSFSAPDDHGRDSITFMDVHVSKFPYPNGDRCRDHITVSPSDAVFNWTIGHTTLSFDSACGPVEVLWEGVGVPNIAQRNGPDIAETQWFRDAIMTATIDGLVVGHFSDGASLYRYSSMSRK
jgi:hypothetical protein